MTMSGHDDVAEATDAVLLPDEQRSGVSRRSVLRTAAGAGIAATAATALAATGAPALAASMTENEAGGAEHHAAEQHEAAEDGPIIAHLRDARTGEIDVFHGTSQVRLHDPALAAHLIRASR
jgi:NAD(P)-dependent dehydrogenase (short-subunit alcohol dehydrogenase family)